MCAPQPPGEPAFGQKCLLDLLPQTKFRDDHLFLLRIHVHRQRYCRPGCCRADPIGAGVIRQNLPGQAKLFGRQWNEHPAGAPKPMTARGRISGGARISETV